MPQQERQRARSRPIRRQPQPAARRQSDRVPRRSPPQIIIVKMSHTITLIPGDGIGPEVTEAVVRVLARVGRAVDWERHDAGVARLRDAPAGRCPSTLLDSIQRNKVALKGPVTTPIGEGFTSVNVGLRKSLDLYANLRPVWNLPGVAAPLSGRRPGHRPREHRGPLRGARARGGAGRRREPEDHHRERVDAHRRVRLRVRARGTAARR